MVDASDPDHQCRHGRHHRRLSNVASNYTIAQAVSNATALTINKAMLTATANTAARDYGDANPLLSGSITGFKNNQTVADFGGDVWSTTAT